MLEVNCRIHFEMFIKNVENENVEFPMKDRKMKLDDVFKFCTGEKRPGRNLAKESKIEISFVLSPRRNRLRPESRACFRKLKLPLTTSA